VDDATLELADRLLRAISGRHQSQLVAALRTERHERYGALGIRTTTACADRDLGSGRLGVVRNQCGGTRVNTVIVTQSHARRNFLRRFVAPRMGFAACRTQLEQRIADLHRLAGTCVRDREALAVGDDDRRDQALRAPSEHVEIEIQQRLAAAYSRAGGHEYLESLAAQRNGIDADMQENLGPVRGTQRDRVSRSRDGNHFAIARCMQYAFGGIDSDAVTEQPLRENRVGRFVERRAPATQR
jgi:hypothetical protein